MKLSNQFLALLSLAVLSSCNGIDSNYDGTYQAGNGVQVTFSSSGFALSHVAQIQDQSTTNVFAGFDDMMKNLSENKSGIFIMPDRTSLQGLPVPGLFGMRNSQQMEQATGYTFSQDSSDVYVVLNPALVDQGLPFGKTLEGSAVVLAFTVKNNPSGPVQEFDATLAVAADIVVTDILIPSAYTELVGFKADENSQKLHFTRLK